MGVTPLGLLFCFAVFLLHFPALHAGLPSVLKVERASRLNHTELNHVRDRDSVRHRRLLGSDKPYFTLNGSFNPSTFGMYYTRIKLGSPPKEFYVQIDTGSDALWVTCSSCKTCPTTSAFGVPLSFYNPNESLTSSFISCADKLCFSAIESFESTCPSLSQNLRCSYSFEFADGSSTTGYYISDILSINDLLGENATPKTSTSVMFGCSSDVYGMLAENDGAINGILGFGPTYVSVISQLSSKGLFPRVFSHCFEGSEEGGGVLLLGEIEEHSIVYTPLIKNKAHYYVNLQSININGTTLPIDPDVFATTITEGTVIDSGTSLTYLADEAYNIFTGFIIDFASTTSSLHNNDTCFLTTRRIDEVFPLVTLNFEGSASLELGPHEYLLPVGVINGAQKWCISWLRSDGGPTVLGDIVLKDKLFVYDLERQRIGWKKHNCSSPVSVPSHVDRI